MDLFDAFRTSMIYDFAGPLYSPYKPKGWSARYINKLNATARIYQMALAFNNPQCKVSSFQQKLWPFAGKYEINVNRVAANINLNSTFRERLRSPSSSCGAAKVRMADAGCGRSSPTSGWTPASPGVDRISWQRHLPRHARQEPAPRCASTATATCGPSRPSAAATTSRAA